MSMYYEYQPNLQLATWHDTPLEKIPSSKPNTMPPSLLILHRHPPKQKQRRRQRRVRLLQILQRQTSVLRRGLLTLQGVFRPDTLGIHKFCFPGLYLVTPVLGFSRWKLGSRARLHPTSRDSLVPAFFFGISVVVCWLGFWGWRNKNSGFFGRLGKVLVGVVSIIVVPGFFMDGIGIDSDQLVLGICRYLKVFLDPCSFECVF